jgi:hypothetical protein
MLSCDLFNEFSVWQIMGNALKAADFRSLSMRSMRGYKIHSRDGRFMISAQYDILQL